MSLPSWIYKLGSLGAFALLLQYVLRPMFSTLKNHYFKTRDQPVWEVLRKPQMKVEGHEGTKPFYGNTEVPYSVEEIVSRVSRSTDSIRRSLRRLERLGKVKEVHGGWQRKEK